MIKKVAIIILLFAATAYCATGKETSDLFEEGKILYKKYKYEEALKKFKDADIIMHGLEVVIGV